MGARLSQQRCGRTGQNDDALTIPRSFNFNEADYGDNDFRVRIKPRMSAIDYIEQRRAALGLGDVNKNNNEDDKDDCDDDESYLEPLDTIKRVDSCATTCASTCAFDLNVGGDSIVRKCNSESRLIEHDSDGEDTDIYGFGLLGETVEELKRKSTFANENKPDSNKLSYSFWNVSNSASQNEEAPRMRKESLDSTSSSEDSDSEDDECAIKLVSHRKDLHSMAKEDKVELRDAASDGGTSEETIDADKDTYSQVTGETTKSEETTSSGIDVVKQDDHSDAEKTIDELQRSLEEGDKTTGMKEDTVCDTKTELGSSISRNYSTSISDSSADCESISTGQLQTGSSIGSCKSISTMGSLSSLRSLDDMNEWMSWRMRINHQLSSIILKTSKPGTSLAKRYPSTMNHAAIKGVVDGIQEEAPSSALDRASYLVYGIPRASRRDTTDVRTSPGSSSHELSR